VASLSALYSIGVASAAMAQPSSTVLQPMQIPNAEFLAQQQQRSQLRGQRVLNRNGVNVSLNRVKQADKFKADPKDVQGEFTYIVETYGNTLVGWQQQQRQQQAQRPAPVLANVSPRIAFQSPQLVSQELAIFEKQDQLLNQANQVVGRSLTPSFRYSKVLNGFSVKLSQQEAIKLAKLAGVKKITKSKLYQLATDQGPTHIGADKVWAGNTVLNTPFQGEGMLVGIIDTGINTDHPSFSPMGQDGYQVTNPLGSGQYLGDCQLWITSILCSVVLIKSYFPH